MNTQTLSQSLALAPIHFARHRWLPTMALPTNRLKQHRCTLHQTQTPEGTKKKGHRREREREHPQRKAQHSRKVAEIQIACAERIRCGSVAGRNDNTDTGRGTQLDAATALSALHCSTPHLPSSPAKHNAAHTAALGHAHTHTHPNNGTRRTLAASSRGGTSHDRHPAGPYSSGTYY